MARYVIGPNAESNPTVGVTINGRYSTLRVGQPFDPAADVLFVLQQSNFADDMSVLATDLVPAVRADFQNGIYQINGVSKTLAEVCVENLDWGAFSPGDVVPGVGYKIQNNNGGFVLTAPAFSALGGNNITVLIEGEIYFPGLIPTTGTGFQVELVTLPSYSHFWNFYIAEEPSGVSTSYMSDGTNTVLSSVDLPGGLKGFHKMAFTFSDARFAQSVDGSAPSVSSAVPQIFGAGPTHLAMYLYGGSDFVDYIVCRRVSFYSALTDAQLQTLSAL